jgi:hypothetical protein
MFWNPCVHVLAGPISLHVGSSTGPWVVPMRSPLGKDMHVSSVPLQDFGRAIDNNLIKDFLLLPQLYVKAIRSLQDMSSRALSFLWPYVQLMCCCLLRTPIRSY